MYASSIIRFVFWSSYRQIARIFKWLTLVLGAYVLAAFFSHVPWRQALVAAVLPQLEWSKQSLSVLVGILGTTISPYLFFWQASQEVEEERAMGPTLVQRKGTTNQELQRRGRTS